MSLLRLVGYIPISVCSYVSEREAAGTYLSSLVISKVLAKPICFLSLVIH